MPADEGAPLADLAALLRGARLTWQTEGDLQAELGRVLTGAGHEHEREVVLGPRERIDFLLADGTGVEVKTQGSPTAVVRQLQRYAGHDRVSRLLLATTRPHLRSAVPTILGGKPVAVVVMNGAAW